jgi:thiosulfate reductase cytochrome b subunit
VGNGLVYVISGLVNRHFKTALLSQTHPIEADDLPPYTTPQRWAYLGVIFLLFPLMIATGLAMSPAVSSVFPLFVQFFGGHQSARTVHFFAAVILVLFLVAHVVMVFRNGFRNRMRSMIYGRSASREVTR